MTDKEAIKNIKELLRWYLKEEPMSETVYKREAVEMAIKALEQQPNRCDSCTHSEEQDGSNCYECVKGMGDNFEAQPTDEDCISREEVLKYIDKMPSELTTDGRRMIRRRTLEEYISDTLPSVTPRTNLAETSQDCISRQAVTDTRICEGISCNECSFNTCEDGQSGCLLKERVDKLPSVYPERINLDVIEKIKKSIDEMTEIHSDGEFYIKNVDAKWIIGKYLYGAEMSGGGEQCNSTVEKSED